ncbi:uroporphyrinogen decarboxylase [Alicyclobacillus tolerans]|uniref:Uroporphyrinogen decarboxylase n=1 Tax=Alicyclobacillus tolerans TaxID=90970 RepID=A0ABT9LSR3_9BACL|nr:uroporphyrinogen decarboxylase [Alicyclobacillus tengchongensis]MDP9727295.1 uroporphyrinogen decarboxylase [Alicyclobacillus tengchongensis]
MSISNSIFLKACVREPVSRAPVWYMRQAGRYDADYREIRKQYSLVEICQRPQICADVTRMPVEKLGVDAAILFSDIMIPIGAMGLDFEIKENIGPVIETPIRSKEDVNRLRLFEPGQDLWYVLETIERLRHQLHVPLIGFTGAPFTLASYMIEGGPSREYIETKRLMYSQPDVWKMLMDKLGEMIILYGKAQVKAGAQALQLFDSWVGSLSPDAYETYVYPTMKHIFDELRPLGVPLILFGVTTGELLTQFQHAGASVIGVDWRVPIRRARERLGTKIALQGNLDPALLQAPWNVLEAETRKLLEEGLRHPGYIFNLGHGVRPSVDIQILKRLTEFVHTYSEEWLAQQLTSSSQ